MAIVSCEHHTGIGLCSYCRSQQETYYSESAINKKSFLDQNKSTLQQSIAILKNLGYYSLASDIENIIK